MRIRTAFLLMGLLVGVLPVSAHHSFTAEYDSGKVRQFMGTVTKVEWTNPHARFYLDVKDERGTVTNWNFELGSPLFLRRVQLKVRVTLRRFLVQCAPVILPRSVNAHDA